MNNKKKYTLAGQVNPSAKLPFTIERRWSDSPAAGNYDETRREKKVYYREGIFTGYRGYDRSGTEPLFAFGYGLSYTAFGYSNLSVNVVDRKKAEVEVAFDLTNTGQRVGKEVAQVYVGDVESSVERPLKELKGFEKVELAPGETRRVRIVLHADDFKFFSDKKNAWVLERGAFSIKVGSSSRQIRLEKTVRL